MSLVYHPSENEYISLSGEYIINAEHCISSNRRKGMHGYAVMIYSPTGADEMHAKA